MICAVYKANPNCARNDKIGSFLTEAGAQAAYDAFDKRTVHLPGWTIGDRPSDWEYICVITPKLTLELRHPVEDKDVYVSVEDLIVDPQ